MRPARETSVEASVSAALFSLLTTAIAAPTSARLIRWILIARIALVAHRALRATDDVQRETALTIIDRITPR
jgi:hypothetical protein